MCQPVLIGWRTRSQNACREACIRTPNIRFCQFNVAKNNLCMMGEKCVKMVYKRDFRFIVWKRQSVSRDTEAEEEGCITLGPEAGSCACRSGKCGRPNIKRWFGGKCGVKISQQQACRTDDCDPNYEQRKIVLQGGWSKSKLERHRRQQHDLINSAPQFWGPYVYDFPKLYTMGAMNTSTANRLLPLLFGFNEPNRKTSDGGTSMSVRLAVKYWKLNVIHGIKKGYRAFVAPAISNFFSSETDDTWLPQFLDLISSQPIHVESIEVEGRIVHLEIDWKHSVNYLAVHKPFWAGTKNDLANDKNISASVDTAKALIEDYNRKGFDIQGIWLTHFAGSSTNKCNLSNL